MREELGEVETDAIVWQPFEDGYSIGSLLLHIAEAEAYWVQEVLHGEPLTEEQLKLLLSNDTKQHEGVLGRPPKKPLDYYYALHDDVR